MWRLILSLLAVTAAPLFSQTAASPPAGSGTAQTFTVTFSDPNLTVGDVLINNVLDGRGACYVAFVPSGPASGSVYLVDNAGDAGGPYSGMLLPGNGTVQNSQCSIAAAGSSVSRDANTVTLKLAISFTAGLIRASRSSSFSFGIVMLEVPIWRVSPRSTSFSICSHVFMKLSWIYGRESGLRDSTLHPGG